MIFCFYFWVLKNVDYTFVRWLYWLECCLYAKRLRFQFLVKAHTQLGRIKEATGQCFFFFLGWNCFYWGGSCRPTHVQVSVLSRGTWKPGDSTWHLPGLVEHAKLSQRVETRGWVALSQCRQSIRHPRAQWRAVASWERQAGGQHPRQDFRAQGATGAPWRKKPDGVPAIPSQGQPPQFHQEGLFLTPGLGGHTRYLLGAEAERQKPEAWGLRRVSGAGGRRPGQSQASWLYRVDPHFPMRKGLFLVDFSHINVSFSFSVSLSNITF